MSHPQCPNIKTDILELRAKISELKTLKIKLLQGDTMYEKYLQPIKHDIDVSAVSIENIIDCLANEILWPNLLRDRKYLFLGGEYSQGRFRVRSLSGFDEFHIDLHGNPFYSERYQSAGDYIDGAARIKTVEGNCFHIDLQGKPRYKEMYKSVSDYFRGKAKVETFDGQKFKIDLDGNRIVD
jgi:hypothetical protein